ncbi:MAG: hypothetical protein KKB50_05905 [Planctomycetes bacterium]|nr:hypothetical protein [Planctomycetota bacterium]
MTSIDQTARAAGPDRAGSAPPPAWQRAGALTLGVWAALSLALAAPANTLAAPLDEVQIRLTAVTEDTTATIGDQTQVRAGNMQFLYADETLPVSLRGRAGRRSAILNIATLETTLVLHEIELELSLRDDGGLTIAVPAGEENGCLDVYHAADEPLTVLSLLGASVGLPRGALRVQRLPNEELDVRVGHGRASIVSSGGELVLDADGMNAVTLRSDGTPGEPRRDDTVAALMAGGRSDIMQRSLLPDLVRVAEAVAEGDIEPPTRGARIAAVSVAPTVRLSEVVPRGGATVSISVGATGGQAGTAASTADVFLGSGQAALAVVGARLERTRIIGNPGTTSRAPLSISGELRNPFTLGR